ncbi:hypothetical protein M404DRAFT_585335 [Pisolithus tinctorius Marx 270]|uniref:Uncharacterized protein n=1 Tax=Pisolithus tinctorius Marx 270 TaxID=870435 RepID=A0A0C3JWR0_PISTI|nr:hypothetical protein M404DRAFT_585335 [Pisolithus tinctorius Marx 270]
MVQTSVEDRQDIPKTIFAEVPPAGRGMRRQDHLGMPTDMTTSCRPSHVALVTLHTPPCARWVLPFCVGVTHEARDGARRTDGCG